MLQANPYTFTSLRALQGAAVETQIIHNTVLRCLSSSFFKRGAVKSIGRAADSVTCS